VAGPPLTLSPLPVGGSALLQFYGAPKNYVVPDGVTQLTLTRTGSDGSDTQIYQGAPVAVWVDVGDGPSTSSSPLDPTVEYTWTATDETGSTVVGPTTLSGAIVTVPDALTNILIRLLQAACDNAPGATNASVEPAQVTTKTPAGGWLATPFIVVNPALIQQQYTAVGQDIIDPNAANLWTMPGWSRRVWQVSVLSQNADERDFYRDTLLLAFRALKATFFNYIGSNISHNFQAASGTSVDEYQGTAPVFYWAELMLTVEGEFVVTIATNYGLIEQIDLTATSDGVSTEAQVPTTEP
jgi:hypothetical protein